MCRKSLAELLEKPELNFELAICLLEDNYMKKKTLTNPTYLYLVINMNIGGQDISKDMVWEENKIKLLGTTIDNELKFDIHILNICSKTNEK